MGSKIGNVCGKKVKRNRPKEVLDLILKAMGSLSRLFKRELMPELCFKRKIPLAVVQFDGGIIVGRGSHYKTL